MSTQTLAISEEQMLENGLQLRLVGDPEKQLADATKACTVLMRVVEDKHLFEEFGTRDKKKRHLLVEAWLFLGHMFGIVPRLESIVPVSDEVTGHPGFEATIEALHFASGKIVGRAAARCMANEENWGEVPKYKWEDGERSQDGTRQKAMQQLESMAQTRATSKVLSQLLRWVVVLGATGVSGTPAEEMGGKAGKPKQSAEAGTVKRISDGQRKRIFAIAHEVGMDINSLPALYKRHGFNQAFEITTDKYDAIVAEIQGHKAAAATQ